MIRHSSIHRYAQLGFLHRTYSQPARAPISKAPVLSPFSKHRPKQLESGSSRSIPSNGRVSIGVKLSDYESVKRSKGATRQLNAKRSPGRRRDTGQQREQYDDAADEHRRRLQADFESALEAGKTSTVLDLYKKVRPLQSPRYIRPMIALLARDYRQAKDKDAVLPELLKFASIIGNDITSGILPTYSFGPVRLLRFYGETRQFEEGVSFWTSLVSSNEPRLVTSNAYGAIIHLLAERGEDRLEKLEALYNFALQQDPRAGLRWEFSPNAIIQSRGVRYVNDGLPFSLLEGIYHARLRGYDDYVRPIEGDRGPLKYPAEMVKAYLALDTALRLMPENFPPWFFYAPILNRPAPEAYAAFMMACRMGVVPARSQLEVLCWKLVDWPQQRLPDFPLRLQKINQAKSILKAIEAHVTVGGEMKGEYLTAFISCLGQCSWHKSEFQQESIHKDAANAVMSAMDAAIELFRHFKIPFHPKMFPAMIWTTSVADRSDTLETLQKMADLDMQPDTSVFVALVGSAGYDRNKDLVKSAWRYLADLHCEQGSSASTSLERGWKVFASACRRANLIDYAREQIAEPPMPIEPELLPVLESILGSEPEEYRKQPFDSSEAREITSGIEEIRDHVQAFLQRVKSGESLDYAQEVPTTHLPGRNVTTRLGIQEADLRRIYDEMTTDPHLENVKAAGLDANYATLPQISSMGIPYDVLRFENWKSVNNLLMEAVLTQSPSQGTGPLWETLNSTSVGEDGLSLRKVLWKDRPLNRKLLYVASPPVERVGYEEARRLIFELRGYKGRQMG
ncbi:MAG: hypothetical protein M1820_008302 [Bogoriella megaspora]|nr:MAG: hypothetical protein M1820_008302 [Bogoriella megaspora]